MLRRTCILVERGAKLRRGCKYGAASHPHLSASARKRRQLTQGASEKSLAQRRAVMLNELPILIMGQLAITLQHPYRAQPSAIDKIFVFALAIIKRRWRAYNCLRRSKRFQQHTATNACATHDRRSKCTG